MRLIDPEPIIKNLSAMKTQLGYDTIDIDGMIKALREAEEVTTVVPPNDPLTLKQLREMDGDPVWDLNLSQWGIVDIHGFNGNGCIRYVNNWWHPRCLMDRRFYRRKPEKVPTSSDGETGSQGDNEPWKDSLRNRFDERY